MYNVNFSDTIENDTYKFFTNFSYDTSPNLCASSVSLEVKNFVNVLSLLFYCLTCVLGVPGNAVVVWVAGMKMKRTVNTIWFLNLAVADLLCCLSVPFTVAEILLEHHWPYGSAMCKVLPAVIVLNMFASVFTLVLIALDRFLQVVKPVWSQNNRRLSLARICCIIVWVLALFLSLPTMIFRQTWTDNFFNVTLCFSKFDDFTEEMCDVGESATYAVLTVARLVFGFLVPFICISVCYVLIGQKVGSGSRSNARSSRALRIMLAVVTAFFVSWIPYHVVDLARVYGGERISDLARAVDPLVVSLAYVNSCMNPLLYVFMGQDFKEKVKVSMRRVFERAFSEDATRSSTYSRAQSRATNSSDAQL